MHDADIAVLRRETVMRGSSTEAYVIRIGDAAGVRDEIAVAQSIRPLLRRYEQVVSPGCAFEPSFVAQRCNNVIRCLGADAKKSDYLRAGRLAATLLGEGQDDAALLGR